MPISQSLDGRRILIVATDGYEQSELTEPRRQLGEAGAAITVASLKPGEIRGWDKSDWGDSVKVDAVVSEVNADVFDALVLPGGQINPDLLRVEDDVLTLIRAFDAADKPLAAICHAPWLLIEAGVIRGRRATGYHSIRTDLANAGAMVADEQVVVDGNLITSRKPDDLDAFCAKIAEIISERAPVAA